MTQVFAPERMPQVALPEMNETHSEELALVNRIGEMLDEVAAGTADRSALLALLDEWLAHTRAHFDNEHRIMEESGFPAYPVHRAEHERVLAQLQETVEAYRASGALAPLRAFVFEQWPAWFENHVNTMDFATAHFASMMAQGGPPV